MARRTEVLVPRSIRTTNALWTAAADAATYNNEDVSAVIRRDLAAYVERTNRAKAKAEADAEAATSAAASSTA